MSKYKEIFRLKEMLDKAKIQYDFLDRSVKDEKVTKILEEPFNFYQICCPNDKDRYISIVEGWRYIRKR